MELLRAWIADRRQIVELTHNLRDDPRTWGLLPVDMVKHIAQAYETLGASFLARAPSSASGNGRCF
jgi:hypothetical protein